MKFANKISVRLRLSLLKAGGGTLLIALLLVFRELGWRDVGFWPASIALMLVLAILSSLVWLATHPNISQETQIPQESCERFAKAPRATTGKPTPETDQTSILYRLHQLIADPALDTGIESALCLLVELLPDKLVTFYRNDGSTLIFIAGARINSRQRSEKINSGDSLIEELKTRIDGCIDTAVLRQPGRFTRPLTFSRDDQDEAGMLLPVVGDDALFGVLAVLSTTGQQFSVSEREFLQHFCASFAIAYSNNRRQSSIDNPDLAAAERSLTRRIFSRLLPESAKSLPGWDIAQLTGYCDEHSGDFHDFINLPGNHLLIIAGRTSAGGIDAALYVARLHTMLECLCTSFVSPADLFNRLSVMLNGDKSFDLFSSLVAMLIRANDRTVSLAIAGHALPLINRPRSGYVEIPQLAGGVPMGLFNQGVEPYQNQIIHLLPGDGILIYTDGATNYAGEHASRFGNEDLRLLLDKMPEQYADDLLANLADHLIPEARKEKPLEDYTIIYASTE